MLELRALGAHFVGFGFAVVLDLGAQFGAGGAEEVGFLLGKGGYLFDVLAIEEEVLGVGILGRGREVRVLRSLRLILRPCPPSLRPNSMLIIPGRLSWPSRSGLP